MNKKLLGIAVAVIVLLGLFFLLDRGNSSEKAGVTEDIIAEENLSTQDKIVSELEEFAVSLTEESVLTSIVGLWQSLDDSKYTLEMQEGGAMIERYSAPQAETNGTWELISYEEGPR